MKFPPARIWLLTLMVVLTIFYVSESFASTAKQQLDAFYKNVQSMQADFVQTVVSDAMTRKDESSGVLRFQRPGKFRWDYKEPYEQQIVADGEKLWVYDMDMDQVIVKPLDFVLGNTPAILLSGNVDLTEKFDIDEFTAERTDASDPNEYVWLRLKPKQEDAGFQQMALAFKDNNLMQMELVDSFGQMTRLVFSNLRKNPVIDASVFQFVPPKGVDVIGDEE